MFRKADRGSLKDISLDSLRGRQTTERIEAAVHSGLRKLNEVGEAQAKLLAALNAIEERQESIWKTLSLLTARTGDLEERVGRSIEDILRIDQKIFFARKPPTALSSGKQGKVATKKRRK